MAKIAFKGSAVNTNGSLPAVGAEAPDFKGVKSDLSELSLKELKGKNVGSCGQNTAERPFQMVLFFL